MSLLKTILPKATESPVELLQVKLLFSRIKLAFFLFGSNVNLL